MIGRTPGDAVRAYLDALQLILSTVTRSVLVIGPGGFRPRDRPHDLRLSEAPARLTGSRITLRFEERYRLVDDAGSEGPWRVQAVAYAYSLDDRDGPEIVAYHWHPEGHSHVTAPHFHLGVGAGVVRRDLTDAHLPTGLVPLSAVLRAAIEAFGARPLRPDWKTLLDLSRYASTPWPMWGPADR